MSGKLTLTITRGPILADIAEVIDRSLATKESERYQHAGEMYEALLKAWNAGR